MKRAIGKVVIAFGDWSKSIVLKEANNINLRFKALSIDHDESSFEF